MKMSEAISVLLYGPLYSSVLNENERCKVQQEGFLLGEIIQQETKAITDNVCEQVKITKVIKINSVVPCPFQHHFYNGIGKVDENKLKSLLGEQFGKVVAWYRFQRYQSSLHFTLRQKLIHKQLQKLFKVPQDVFTCCVINSELSDIGATHSYSKTFIKWTENGYDQLPIQVLNLALAPNIYKSLRRTSITFKRLRKDIQLDTKNTHGLVAIKQIENAIQKHIDNVADDVTVDDCEIRQLEMEIEDFSNGNRNIIASPVLFNNKEKEVTPSRNKAIRGGRGRGRKKSNSDSIGKMRKKD